MTDYKSMLPTRNFVKDPDGNLVQGRGSEVGHYSLDGINHADNNSDPSNIGIILHQRAETPGDGDQTFRPTGIASTDDNAKCLDVAIRDESGNHYTVENPLPVYISETPGGSEAYRYKKTFEDVLEDAAPSETLTVATGKKLRVEKVYICASGSAKLLFEAGLEGSLEKEMVIFNSTAEPQHCYEWVEDFFLAAGDKLKITVTNRDKQTQDIFVVIEGELITVV